MRFKDMMQFSIKYPKEEEQSSHLSTTPTLITKNFLNLRKPEKKHHWTMTSILSKSSKGMRQVLGALVS